MKKILWFFVGIFLFSTLQAQQITITQAPENYQLYPRDENNRGQVVVAGSVLNKDYQQLELKIFKDGQLLESKREEIQFDNQGIGSFSYDQSIEAGLFQYRFELSLMQGQKAEVFFTADSVVCGDAYIITGQSNSHASSSASTFNSPFCRSFGVKTGYNPYTDDHEKYRWGRATGNSPDLEGIGGWFTDNPFGVGVWGMHLMQQIMETYKVPVCIINGGSGSSSIEENMPAVYQADLNTSFGRLIHRVHEAGLTKGIKAILWHQGESNSREEYGNYSQKFDTLYQTWKTNFPSLEKIYVFQLHPGCGGDFQSELRNIQLEIAHKYEDVEIMSTTGLPGHDGCHYSHEGYVAMAESVFPLVTRDFYGAHYEKPITPPQVVRAYISDLKVPEICLEFDQNVVWNDKQVVNGTPYFLKDYFYLNDNLASGLIREGHAQGNKVFLTLAEQGTYNQLTYLPGHFYDNTELCYEGPWIMGENGIGALSFHKLRLQPIGTVYEKLPVDLQLFPRNDDNKATLLIEGTLLTNGFDKAVCKIYRNEALHQTLEADIKYADNKAAFSFNPEIEAELAEYTVETGFLVDGEYFKDRSVHNIVSGDVFLINGQSNSHPARKEAVYKNEFCRSFGSNTNYDVYDPADTTWGLAVGDIRDQYHVSAWGIKLMEKIVENYEVPVCIINGGSGGSTIEYNLPIDNQTDLNATYNRLLYRAKKAGVDLAVKAILWHQGESNSNEDQYSTYAENFHALYSAWKKDYPSIEKVFVFQIHPGCGGERQSEIRETQRQLAATYDDVEVMSTLGLPGHDGCHYTKEGYSKMGEWIFPLLAKTFYDQNIGQEAYAPNITDAHYADEKEICLVFDQNVKWDTQPANGHYLKDQFYLDGQSGKVTAGRVEGNKVYLELQEPYLAKKVTYLPGHFYEGTEICYEGPWLFGENEIGALSFHSYEIRDNNQGK